MRNFRRSRVKALDWARARVTRNRGLLTIELLDPSLSVRANSGAQSRWAEPGEMIKGIVRVEAEQDLGPGTVIVTLVGTKQWSITHTPDDGSPRTRVKSKDFYEERVIAGEHFTVAPGLPESVPFAIAAPLAEDAVGPGPGIGKALGALNATSYSEGTYRWELVARYDVPGVDLQDRHRIWAGARPR